MYADTTSSDKTHNSCTLDFSAGPNRVRVAVKVSVGEVQLTTADHPDHVWQAAMLGVHVSESTFLWLFSCVLLHVYSYMHCNW